MDIIQEAILSNFVRFESFRGGIESTLDVIVRLIDDGHTYNEAVSACEVYERCPNYHFSLIQDKFRKQNRHMTTSLVLHDGRPHLANMPNKIQAKRRIDSVKRSLSKRCNSMIERLST